MNFKHILFAVLCSTYCATSFAMQPSRVLLRRALVGATHMRQLSSTSTGDERAAVRALIRIVHATDPADLSRRYENYFVELGRVGRYSLMVSTILETAPTVEHAAHTWELYNNAVRDLTVTEVELRTALAIAGKTIQKLR